MIHDKISQSRQLKKKKFTGWSGLMLRHFHLWGLNLCNWIWDLKPSTTLGNNLIKKIKEGDSLEVDHFSPSVSTLTMLMWDQSLMWWHLATMSAYSTRSNMSCSRQEHNWGCLQGWVPYQNKGTSAMGSRHWLGSDLRG